MTRLDQIGVTVGVGFFVQSMAIVFFGIAVKMRSTHIAPRCEARPRNVIYNPNPTHPSQNRGNAWLGWVPWVLKLSYEEMLTGVPGTGTRDGGLGGRPLHVNMDNIVMLRFHSYGLRIATVGLFLYIAVLLPIYWTAGCNGDEVGTLGEFCLNMTDYDHTTLSNIIVDPEVAAEFLGLSARLYAVVLCAWIMTAYACYELKQEWIDILAMRRHYFLERDHWKGHQDDYEILWNDSQHDDGAPSLQSQTPKTARRKYRLWKKKKAEEPDYLKNREPWVPHPEMKDTPPAIALYSVLVGGIPSKPAMQMHGDDGDPDIESPEGQNSNRDWQLNVTSAFFDHCIPNQPGFSSSVAAVTMVPNAAELDSAWKRWYAAAAKLRRLRFIRRHIREKRNLGVEVNCVDEEVIAVEPTKSIVDSNSSLSSALNGKETAPGDYNREVLGSSLDEDVEDLFLEALEFGPEQTAVYSREFAQVRSHEIVCCKLRLVNLSYS